MFHRSRGRRHTDSGADGTIAIAQHHDGQQLRSALLYLARGQRYAGQIDAAIATFASVYALLASREPFGSRLRYYYGGDVSYNLMQARRPLGGRTVH